MLAIRYVGYDTVCIFKKKNRRGRVPIYKRADCLDEQCPEYKGVECNSRLELLEASGKSGGKDKAPKVSDCNYALYGQVCMAGVEQLVVNRIAESPNGNADTMELVAPAGKTDCQRIALNTPLGAIHFKD